MKILFNSIYYLFVAGIAVIALLLLTTMIPIPGNLQAKVVKSGSMEPSIKTGGIVFVHPSTSYEVGDIITFGKDTKTVIPTTHRIVKVNGNGSSKTFTTKGDANDVADPTDTRLGDVSGKVVFSVPYLGFVLDFARKPLGFSLLVGVPAVVIILEEIGKIIREARLIRRRKQLTNELSK
jgi:signal peptidase